MLILPSWKCLYLHFNRTFQGLDQCFLNLATFKSSHHSSDPLSLGWESETVLLTGPGSGDDLHMLENRIRQKG